MVACVFSTDPRVLKPNALLSSSMGKGWVTTDTAQGWEKFFRSNKIACLPLYTPYIIRHASLLYSKCIQ